MEASKNRLIKMSGKEFIYKTNNVTIKGYKFNSEHAIIITDKTQHTIKLVELDTFLDQFLEVEETAISILPKASVDSKTISSLRDILMSNIEKVKVDKTYIEQSQEINQNVKSIIDLAKAEIEMFKLLKHQ